MVSRTRRGFLTSTVSGSLVVIAGCAGDRSETTPTSEQTPTAEETDGSDEGSESGTPDPIEDIMIGIGNATSEEQSIHVTITKESEMIFQKDVTLDPGEDIDEYTGINEKGQYEVTAETESGLKNSVTFSIEDYSLEQGSNIGVGIHEDQIRIMIEQ